MTNSAPAQADRSAQWQLFWALASAELLMSFSFLGCFHFGPVSVSLAYFPVLVAGCLLTPGHSAAIGSLFGLADMWKASASYVAARERIFSPFLSGAPIQSLLLSVGARTLFGLLIGLLYAWAKRAPRRPMLRTALCSLGAKGLHAMLDRAAIGLLFPEPGYGGGFRDFLPLNNLPDMAFAAVLVPLCWRAWRSASVQEHRRRTALAEAARSRSRHPGAQFLSAAVILALSAAVALHFAQRIRYMLGQDGVFASGSVYFDLIIFQVQFMLGILSLLLLSSIALNLYRQHLYYQQYEGNMDPLTGVFTRRGFSQMYQFLQEHHHPGSTRYYLIMDVDWFKSVNDLHGHPMGDHVLSEVARCLRENFSQLGTIGRLGGDEFSVFVHTPLSRRAMETVLNQLMEDLHAISCSGITISCSIGVTGTEGPEPEEALYHRADQALYISKRWGRDRFSFYDTNVPAVE